MQALSLKKKSAVALFIKCSLFKECLSDYLLKSGFDLIDAKKSSAEGILLETGHKPEIVIIEAGISDIDFSKLGKQYAGKVILLLSKLDEMSQLQVLAECAKNGIKVFVSLENCKLEDFDAAVAAAMSGAYHCELSPELMSRLLINFANLNNEVLQVNDPANILTVRQRQVLNLMKEGLSNKQIAKKLNISLYTAKNHVHSVLKGLGLSSRSQLVW